jgi:hypothetical protein
MDNWTFGTPYITLETVFQTAFSSGALKLSGSPYDDTKMLTFSGEPRVFFANIGIGQSRATAKWLHFNSNTSNFEWISQKKGVAISVDRSPNLYLSVLLYAGVAFLVLHVTDEIPVADDLYGYLYIDIYGTLNQTGLKVTSDGVWQLANMKAEYSRDKITVTSHGAYKVTRDRNSTKEYTAENQSAAYEKWNADCIFASDNDMEYGYGLMLKGNGEYLKTAPFGGVQAIPEQHLANRVAAYGATSKQQFSIEVRSNTIAEITPIHQVSFTGTTCHPTSISHVWRDDITQLTMQQI